MMLRTLLPGLHKRYVFAGSAIGALLPLTGFTTNALPFGQGCDVDGSLQAPKSALPPTMPALSEPAFHRDAVLRKNLASKTGHLGARFQERSGALIRRPAQLAGYEPKTDRISDMPALHKDTENRSTNKAARQGASALRRRPISRPIPANTVRAMLTPTGFVPLKPALLVSA